MPRKKVESEKLTGRISENYSDIKVVEFVRNKLKSMDQAQLVREAIEVLWKYETGKLFKEDLEETLTKVLKSTNININNDPQEEQSSEVDDQLEKEIKQEIESQFDDEGNLDFHF